MPFTSAVGLAQICSSTDLPFSPAACFRPTSFRNFASENFSDCHCFFVCFGRSATPS